MLIFEERKHRPIKQMLKMLKLKTMRTVLNYQRLVALKPTILATHTNQLGQVFDLVEHPIKGDSAPVVIIYHAEKLAQYSDFYEVNDMVQGDDYEPVYMYGQLQCKFECMDYDTKSGKWYSEKGELR